MAGPAHSSTLDEPGLTTPTDHPVAATSASGGKAAAAAPGTVPNGAVPVSICPYFHEAVELIGKRWTGAIVVALLPEPRRFCEIAQVVPQISDRLLSMRLRELESEGLVQREVLEGSPVRVQYTLTDKGRALERSLGELRSWACHWLKPR